MAQVRRDGSLEDPRETITLYFWDWYRKLSDKRQRVVSKWIERDLGYLEEEVKEEEEEEEEEMRRVTLYLQRNRPKCPSTSC